MARITRDTNWKDQLKLNKLTVELVGEEEDKFILGFAGESSFYQLFVNREEVIKLGEWLTNLAES